MTVTAKTHHVCYLRLRSETSGDWLVHPDLRGRLVAEAKRKHVTLTDVVASILAKRHGVKYELTGRSTEPREYDEVLNVRLPIKLWNAVRRAAQREGRRDMDQVRHDLCAHYRLRLPR